MIPTDEEGECHLSLANRNQIHAGSLKETSIIFFFHFLGPPVLLAKGEKMSVLLSHKGRALTKPIVNRQRGTNVIFPIGQCTSDALS